MRGDRCWSVEKRSWIALLLGVATGLAATTARAADCPGHPDALGTSRVLVVDPREHPRIGAMQYKETLPLHDHEVVLTFDDGPLPKYSNQVLQILADQCVKATFFTIGHQAQANPEGVRKLAAAGHTIGTHSQTHPLTFNKMTLEQARPEVDQGIASVKAALGNNASALSPFFRVPGLLRAEAVEGYVGSLGVQMWSADFLADDWRNISSAKVYELAIKRLEARHKGILLLHDIHERTVLALPKILHELKARGYRIVQVVPATANRPATPTEPQDWLVHRPSDNVPVAQWPDIPSFDFTGATTHLSLTSTDVSLLSSGPTTTRRAARETAWPPVTSPASRQTAAALPVPAADLFEIQAPIPRLLARHDALPAQPLRRAAKAARRPVRVASLRKR
ncbi:polysaccharide deacetylase family protein [Bradyrhizobium sp. STM 3557]|uniref:polysaccharide deacetylase family protein n=1 Tax=Bradyrhizobium sp. STM 3557 TaxID=578920 RepID=UPI00388FC905